MTTNVQPNAADEWDELKERDETVDFWIMPIILVFVGMFLGPFATLFFTAVVARFKVPARAALFLIGLAGTTICLVQGVTIVWGAIWDPGTTYTTRGMINLACGVACYAVVRVLGMERGYFVSRRSLLITLIAAGLIVLVYFLIPARVLFALGR